MHSPISPVGMGYCGSTSVNGSKCRRFTNFSIDAILYGDDKNEVFMREEIKAVTYADVKQEVPYQPQMENDVSPKPAVPAWLLCTRYSDRPSAGPKMKKTGPKKPRDKKPRQIFVADQLVSLADEFRSCAYLTEERRVRLSQQLGLSETQIKTWFQNKRAKLKKVASNGGHQTSLANMLAAEGLYNHAK